MRNVFRRSCFALYHLTRPELTWGEFVVKSSNAFHTLYTLAYIQRGQKFLTKEKGIAFRFPSLKGQNVFLGVSAELTFEIFAIPSSEPLKLARNT